MKKLIYIAFIISTVNAKAQDEKCFTKGTSAINIGVGIGSRVDYYFGEPITPIYTGSYEYGIAKVGLGIIGIGVSASYLGNYSLFFTKELRLSPQVIVGGLRATYHPDFCNGKNYDVYVAVQLNGYSHDPNSTYYFSNRVFIYPSLLLGVRYYPIKNIGLFAEFGYDLAIIKGGVSIKFGGK